MSYMNKLIIFAALALAVFAGCDRFTDTPANVAQAPEVRFVNVPIDSSSFSYAPVIFWTGHDPDGFVTGFEYYDDSSPAGIAAYQAGEAAHAEYVANLPDSIWTFTTEASRQIFLLTQIGQVTEHVFLIRSVDNTNLRSQFAARTFFRTNQAPNTPLLRWANSTDTEYYSEISIADTQLVGDSITTTYTGVRLLWQGSDPDSRVSNIIPLEFSYALVRLPDDTVAFPVRDDSNHVIGYREGWTDWAVDAQVALFNLASGDYTFFLRVRDDGFTLADTLAQAHFRVVSPTLSRRLMIVDENKPPSVVGLQRGGINADTLLAFYKGSDGLGGIVRDACALANELAPFIPVQPGSDPIPEFIYDDVFWYDNRNSAPLPYDLISQFDLVWIIDDDNEAPRTVGVAAYTKVLSDYLDIGGKLWITGRRVFNESMAIAPANAPTTFLRDYFNLFSVRSKIIYTESTDPNILAQAGIADFVGAVASDPQYPDLNLDTVMVGRLRYANRPVDFPPEVETFGRSNAPQSFDFSTTIYNYKSSTSDTSLNPDVITNFDCPVDTSLTDSTIVALIPQNEGLPLLAASTIRNVTRNTTADFLRVRNVSTNLLQPKWRIFATTDARFGEWTSNDLLEVTYNFIPLSSEHDEPCATNFVKYEGTIEIEQTENGFRTTVTAFPRFRTSLFTFPLAYMSNEPYTHPIIGPQPAVTLLIANQLLYFNQNLNVSFGGD